MTRIVRFFLAALVLAGPVGCAGHGHDWIESTLVTVDTTGTWVGEWSGGRSARGSLQIMLRQTGQKLSGTMSGYLGIGATGGEGVSGTIGGDRVELRSASGRLHFFMEVRDDEMVGEASTTFGPGRVTLRRQHGPEPSAP